VLGDPLRAGGGTVVRLVGITGNSGSGQSTAAGFVAGLTAGVCSLDEIGHRLLDRDYVARDLAMRLCRPELSALRGTVLRRALSADAFTDRSVLHAIEAALHPRMVRWARCAAATARTLPGIRVLEGALLVELGIAPLLDRLVVVRDTPERCAARAADRDGVDAATIALRWSHQLPMEAKAAMADYVVENDGGKDDLRDRIVSIFRGLNHPG